MGNFLPRTVITGTGLRLELTDQLGAILAEFKKQAPSRSLIILRNIVTIIFFTVVMFSGLRYIYGYIYFGLAAAVAWSRPGLLPAFILIAFWIILYLIKFYSSSVYVHNLGISLLRTGRKPIILHWRQIAGISFFQEESAIFFMNFHKSSALLNPNQGKAIKMDHYCSKQSLPELVTIIKAKLYPILESEIINQIKSGQSVYFGKLSISHSGIKIDNGSYLWEDIEQINITDGFINVILQPHSRTTTSKPKKITISIKQILNPELLMKIAPLANAIR